jgi:hypothetical protein
VAEFEGDRGEDIDISEVGGGGAAGESGAAEEGGVVDPGLELGEEQLGALAVPGVAGGFGVFEEAEGNEAGAVGFALEEGGQALAGEGEVAAAVGVEDVGFEEFGAAAGGGEPGGALLDGVVEAGEGPELAAVEPDVLAGVIERAVAVEAGEVAAMEGVEGMAQPERDDRVEEVLLVEGEQAGEHGETSVAKGLRAGRER